MTVLHELPQEFGDFMLLITVGGATKQQAFLINAISGLFALFGALVFLGANPTNEFLGITLVISAGFFIFVALSEIPLHILQLDGDGRVAKVLIPYALGCLFMGLILLDHEHCSLGHSKDDAGSHDNHGH